ncbi:ribosomal protein S5 domain 2-type protein [Suillus placidus]|uniref:Ribosomal protein S5 domain 2-type protein n=1 Tax=Suillus placidus TaxID=48579 RepID=A0A9P7A5P4_9AGAM|nr:ribosomal protein S5 domain 2-type protein [Suillus placidus]
MELRDFVAKLMQSSDLESVASEIDILQSIYGDHAIHLHHSSPGSPRSGIPNHSSSASGAIRYEVSLNLPSHEDISIRILVSIPPTYPTSSPPQLQLLSRYIGAFGVDSSLFGSILRTFISVSGVEWTPESVCVFDGLQNVLERCEAWYEDKLNRETAGELLREDAHTRNHVLVEPDEPLASSSVTDELKDRVPLDTALPEDIKIVEAEPIVDRKSIFIGRACRISDPSQVPLVLNNLMSERQISRAAHPIINAWRCQVGSVLHQDNDDDGETAAGSRLAHLLSILEINNVLVVVTRWFGGIHLGPDRFKHINHAARNALELGGFLEQTDESRGGGRNAGKGRKR